MTDSRKPSTAGPKEKPYVPIEHRPLLGVSEAAALTGLDEKIVRQAIRQGELIACYAHSSTKRLRRRDLVDLSPARTAPIAGPDGYDTAPAWLLRVVRGWCLFRT